MRNQYHIVRFGCYMVMLAAFASLLVLSGCSARNETNRDPGITETPTVSAPAMIDEIQQTEIAGYTMNLAGSTDGSVSYEYDLKLQTNAVNLIAGIAQESEFEDLCTEDCLDNLNEMLSHEEKNIKGKDISFMQISHVCFENGKPVIYLLFCCLEITDSGYYTYIYFDDENKVSEICFET